MTFRRIVTTLAAAAGTLALAQAPALAFPGDLSAGEYDNTTLTAGFAYFNQTDFSNLNVNVTDVTRAFKPVGAAWTSTSTRQLEVDFFQASLGFGANGCYQLSPGQGTLDSQLGSASLQVTIGPDTPTCNSFSNIPTPFTVDLTLSGTGPLRSSRGLTQESCLDYRFEQTTNQALNPASGSASVSAFQESALSSNFALLQSTEQVTHVQGPTHDSCPQQPGATAGGAGPPNPGRYQSSSTVADATLFNDSGSLGVTLTDSTDTANPLGAPASSTIVKQVNFNMFLNGVFAAGCFLLSPSDYSINGVQSAEVNLYITESTPTCYGNPPDMPLPETLHVVWNNTGPVANFNFQGSFSCLTYHETGQGTLSTSNPNATVTLSPLLGDAVVTPTDNRLTTSSNLNVAAGQKQTACRI
jgi:hypothetical protein